MPDFITHVTLNTGHSRSSPRSEVARETLVAIKMHLAAALEHPALIPGNPPPDGCTLIGFENGPHMVATVQRGDERLVTIAVATRSRGAAEVWELLHDTHPVHALKTERQKVPPAPWCAVRLEAGLDRHPAAWHWLGDYERCVAWAWIELRRSRQQLATESP